MDINREYAPKWPVINATKDPLPTAEEFKEVADKKDQIDPSPGEGS
jgi:hypothetical protein